MSGTGTNAGLDSFQEGYQQAVIRVREGRLDEARALYEALLITYPQSSDVHNDLGHVCRALGQPEQALDHLQEALRLKPDHVGAAYNLGLTYSQLGQFEAAIDSYQQALDIQPQLPEAHNNLANLLRHQGELEQAVDHYRTVLEQQPASVDSAANLAMTLENLHRLEEAGEVAKDALRMQPQHPVATLVLAQVERRQGQLDSARERLEALLAASRLLPVQRAAVSTELGQIMDRMGDYGKAFAAVSRSKADWRELLGPDRCNDTSYIERIKSNQEWFNADMLAGWRSDTPDDGVPPVFLVGFPRSGTTLAEQVLAAHPDIVTSHEKPLLQQLHESMSGLLGRSISYPDDLDQLDDSDLNLLRNAYWNLAESGLGFDRSQQRFVDKLPLNLVDLGFVRRIFPESPVVMMIRDPRDACLSGYMQAFEPNQAMVSFLDLDKTADFYSAVLNLWLHYRDVLGMNWLELRYEDLVTDFEPQARKLLQHVGVDWDEQVLRFNELASERYANTPSYRDVTSPLFRHAIGRWHHYEKEMMPMLGKLEKYVGEFGYDNSEPGSSS